MTDMNKEDQELAEIFSGEDKPLHPDTVHITLGKGVSKKETTTANSEKTAQRDPHKPSHNFKDGKWEPVKEITNMDKLKECVKWAAIFGGLNALLFYWQQAGLLDSKAAVPSMIICALLAGLSIGWNAR